VERAILVDSMYIVSI